MPRASHPFQGASRWLVLATAVGAGLLGPACRSAGQLPAEVARTLPTLEFQGLAALERRELLAALEEDLATLAQDGIDRSDVDDLAFGIELHYRAQGFPDAYVSYEYEPDTLAESAQVVFLVQEGARVEVTRFEIEGNESPGFASEEVEASFFATTTERLGGKRRWYVEADLLTAARELEARYLSAGHLHVSIDEPEVRFEQTDSGRTAQVTLRLREGPRFVLQETQISMGSPDIVLTPEELASIRKLHTDEEGRPLPYTPRLAQSVRAYLLERLGHSARPDARVALVQTLDETTGQVRVTYEVTPGARITIAGVRFRGNEKTLDRFLRRRVTLRPGDDYDLGAVRDSFRRLFATRLFRRVSLDLEPVPGSPGKRILVVEVVELPSREVYAEPGYGSYEGPRIKLGAVEKNLLGMGRSLRGEAILSDKYQRYILGVRDRALFQSDVSGGLAVFFDHREEPSFTYEELGAGTDLRRDWPRLDLETVLGYEFRSTEVVDVKVQGPELNKFLSDIDISSVTLGFAHDTRDHLFVPASGAQTRLQFEWASDSIGSEVDFFFTGVEHSRYYPLPWEDAVIGLGLETGVIAPTGSQEVLPLQVRLFNGGATSVRSFEEDQLGPKDSNGEPVGGETYSVISAEVRQGLVGNLSGALFYDAGNVALRYEDYLEFNGMRQAVGVGVRYLLPIGPARLDFGVNPDPSDDDEDWVLHFAVGLAF